MQNKLGKTYTQIQANVTPFVLPKTPAKRAKKLPAARKLLPEMVCEQTGRQAYYVDARVTVGFWLWKRTVDVVIRKN